jgi:hypothetical protein
MQLQEQKQDKQEVARLRAANSDLALKLDEKLGEVRKCGLELN